MHPCVLEAAAYQDLIFELESMTMPIVSDRIFADLYNRMLNGESPANDVKNQRIVKLSCSLL